LHLVRDILHALAAALWIGALTALFGLLAAPPTGRAACQSVHRALPGFSGIGSVLVAVLVVIGVINSWILVGPDHALALWTTSYGRLLSLKLVLIAAMLGFAAANRFRHTPAPGPILGVDAAPELALRSYGEAWSSKRRSQSQS
jgi:putative copper resistance protein D